jgi:hypothetical protein
MREFDQVLANKRPFIQDMNKTILFNAMDSHYNLIRSNFEVDQMFLEQPFLSKADLHL